MAVYLLGNEGLETENEDYWIAPNAMVIGKVILKRNASVWFGAVLRGDNEPITIGENSNVQDNAVLHTSMGDPCTIGRNVTIGHMAMVHGCVIGDNTLIGIGSVILDGARIGNNCLIGSNALVGPGKVIPDNSVVLGAPGKVIRTVTETDKEGFTRSAMGYVENWRRFKAGLAPDTRNL
ncbi:MAG: gamma carbonic anhydrase family protein [Pseudomonadota bacterium]|jgi:carbonic anhydrase/acetyltransferase-like protein (isoleucine patch superfamily)|nr:gamma carbonic anhydrase family protein [Alphaproteobacteria bacterium]